MLCRSLGRYVGQPRTLGMALDAAGDAGLGHWRDANPEDARRCEGRSGRCNRTPRALQRTLDAAEDAGN